jgi:hypothetical protein
MLGTVAANYIPGDPVWLMLVGPPGSGKTELLNSLRELPNVHNAGTLTEAALLSGSPKRETARNASGGLLKIVGDFGFLVMKDFTSVLSMHREKQAAVVAALREIYDGRWTRLLGSDGGRSLSWEGKLGVLAGVTQTIDSHHVVMAAMGERFIFCRLRETHGETQARMALAHAGREGGMRKELSRVVAELFQHVHVPADPPALSAAEEGTLVGLASLAARLRSAVERDPRTREIELVPDPESPNRLVLVLRKLLAGLQLIGVNEAEAWVVLRCTALDSAPILRRTVFEVLAHERAETNTKYVAQKLRYPVTTVRRNLEELAAHGLVEHLPDGQSRADRWMLPEDIEMLYTSLWESVPETSETSYLTPTHRDDISGKACLI